MRLIGAAGRPGRSGPAGNRHARLVRNALAGAGVDVAAVRTVDRPTGTALVLLTPDGENSIVASPGANHTLDAEAAEAATAAWTRADILVLNLETAS